MQALPSAEANVFEDCWDEYQMMMQVLWRQRLKVAGFF